MTLSSFFVNWGMDAVWLFREASHQKCGFTASSKCIAAQKHVLGLVGASQVLLPILLFPNQFTFSLLLLCVIDVWVESITNTFLAFFQCPKETLIFNSYPGLTGSRLGGAIGLVLIGMDHPLAYAMGVLANIVSLLFVLRAMKPSSQSWVIRKHWYPLGGNLSHIHFSELLVLIYSQADVTLLALLAENLRQEFILP